MIAKKNKLFLIALAIGSVLLISGIAATNNSQNQEKEASLTVTATPAGPVQAACFSPYPYTNTSGQAQQFMVTASDDCPSRDSRLLIDSTLWAMVPDGQSVTFSCLTLQPGETLKLNCRGVGPGNCNWNLSPCP